MSKGRVTSELPQRLIGFSIHYNVLPRVTSRNKNILNDYHFFRYQW